jgi:hypothetical protein
MIIGLSVHNFTLLHVATTLVAIVSGMIVLFGMLGVHRLRGWTTLFLVTTILTSVTGFMFPIQGFTPALGVGIISLVILAIALLALYSKHLAGSLALDLCRHGRHRALVQRFRADRAVVPEDLGPADTGTDPVRATFPDRPGSSVGHLPCARHHGGVEIPSGRDFSLVLRVGPAGRMATPQKGRSHRRRRLQPI